MRATMFAVWRTLFVFFQALAVVSAEELSCVPGFQSDVKVFKVDRMRLGKGTVLGKVKFTDCSARMGFPFISDDGRFVVQTDGVVKVNRPVFLCHGYPDFLIHTWDFQGCKMTIQVIVQHNGNQQQNAECDSENTSDADIPVLHFPKSNGGLRRRKREWVIPNINVYEDDRGPYPLKISQIRSNEDTVKKIFYSITGPGADQPPVGLFTVKRDNGNLYVSQPLDREKQAKYMLDVHAVAEDSGNAEEPFEIVVNVIDQNDNKPVFEKDTFFGEVAEASPIGFEVVKANATDADQPNHDYSDLRYTILSQDPMFPVPNLFAINEITGVIRVNAGGLDREKYPKYTLTVQAADMKGNGLTGNANVILTVLDSNDNAPVFTKSSYEASVEENRKDVIVLKMTVEDGDDAHSPAWNAKFRIIDGDPGKHFSVETGSSKNEGILTTVKGLDYEKNGKHILLIAAENEVPFAIPLTTYTANVTINVIDVNEPPVFDPVVKFVVKPEDLPIDSDVVQYIASDPDIERKQKVMYKIISDPDGWLNVDQDTGLITVRSAMDFESVFVKSEKYTALIRAYDNDEVPATGTGTLIIQLQDVNDNAPTIVERSFTVCNKESAPQLLSVIDKDGPGYTAPYRVSLEGMSKTNWTARMNETKTGIILNLAMELPSGEYNVILRVGDNQGLELDSTVQAKVCDCTGEDVVCKGRVEYGAGLPVILGIRGGIFLLLLLLLFLLLYARRRSREVKEPLPQEDDVRDNVYYYDKEGDGEDDQ
ncbi:cadherin-1-like isoform X2 [Corythoichthys intestinalis]|uniref:cadherin-1-like isoform X2 n=1 Tax=Corythoichthys intestinalis TaxID=161448 RepID=UPI0025A53E5E|nr:cadherin-1-like isoform X2 [Corythoichthys intestinalis]